MFFGQYKHTVDSKNRVIVPARLREAMGRETEGLVFFITRGMDKCLYFFPEETFDEYVEQLGFKLLIGRKKRQTFRQIFSKAARRVCDKQGRIQIPENLIKIADLKDEVTFVGFKDRIELWDSATLEEMDKNTLQDFEKLAEELIGEE